MVQRRRIGTRAEVPELVVDSAQQIIRELCRLDDASS